MADDVLSGGLDRDVDAVGERLEEVSTRPCVVHGDDRARIVCHLGDRRDVHDLEGQRTR